MSGSARFPGWARASLIDQRARWIANPSRRLRYLRDAAAGRIASRSSWSPWARLAGVLALLFIPLQPVRNAVSPPLWRMMARGEMDRQPPAVWLLEKDQDHETYSNGLRIENRYAIETRPRRYAVFERGRPERDGVEWRTQPAGIVYHATESDMAPLVPEQSTRQLQIDEALLAYVRRRRSYHFVIDRFGRVYRVAGENGIAYHAGHSIWEDQRSVYLNLNAAFLGVAFESKTEGGQEKPLEPPQVQAGHMLTDMLRSRYRLPAETCVTHAQVSVNPGNMEIGYHTDWASNFPFAALGLADNYALPVAGVALFAFGYDDALVRASGGHAWPGLTLAADTVQEEAVRQGLSTAEYSRLLRNRYRQKTAALKKEGAALEETEETSDEQ